MEEETHTNTVTKVTGVSPSAPVCQINGDPLSSSVHPLSSSVLCPPSPSLSVLSPLESRPRRSAPCRDVQLISQTSLTVSRLGLRGDGFFLVGRVKRAKVRVEGTCSPVFNPASLCSQRLLSPVFRAGHLSLRTNGDKQENQSRSKLLTGLKLASAKL